MIKKKKQSVETNPTERSLFAYKIFGSLKNIAIFVIAHYVNDHKRICAFHFLQDMSLNLIVILL